MRKLKKTNVAPLHRLLKKKKKKKKKDDMFFVLFYSLFSLWFFYIYIYIYIYIMVHYSKQSIELYTYIFT
jgi:hypothetical protein